MLFWLIRNFSIKILFQVFVLAIISRNSYLIILDRCKYYYMIDCNEKKGMFDVKKPETVEHVINKPTYSAGMTTIRILYKNNSGEFVRFDPYIEGSGEDIVCNSIVTSDYATEISIYLHGLQGNKIMDLRRNGSVIILTYHNGLDFKAVYGYIDMLVYDESKIISMLNIIIKHGSIMSDNIAPTSISPTLDPVIDQNRIKVDNINKIMEYETVPFYKVDGNNETEIQCQGFDSQAQLDMLFYSGNVELN